MMILSIFATVVLLGVLFYHRVSLFLSSLILLAWTAALGVVGLWNIWVLVPLAIILLPFNLTPMRKSMISAPVFKGFRKVMPPMSRTRRLMRARPGGKAICSRATRTGKSCTTTSSRV